MANKHRGEVELQAGDKIYKLSFSANALCELEDALDMGVTEVAELLGKGMRIKPARAVFWAGLRDHHPDIDMKGAGKLMTEAGITTSMEAVGEAFSLAFPDQQGGDANPQKPGSQKSGTGPAS